MLKRYGHNQIDTEHILLALIEQPGGAIPQILKILKVDTNLLADRLDDYLRTSPKANILGGGTNQIFITPRVKRMIDLSIVEADRLKTVYISPEHLFLAMLSEYSTPAARLLDASGVTRDRVYEAIHLLRDKQPATDPQAEPRYHTSGRHSQELTQLGSTQNKTPDSSSRGATRQEPIKVKVWTEGCSDWKHLKAAYKRLKAKNLYPRLQIEFQEYEYDMGYDALQKNCQAWRLVDNPVPILCVFDRDIPNTLRTIVEGEKDYKYLGNRVYSIALPIPSHRTETPDICIEFLYQDEAIKTIDENGRRLYIGTEFNSRTLRHKEMPINCADKNKAGKFTIVGDQVFRMDVPDENNIALTKNQFADYVLNGHPGFDNFDVQGFIPLFELIETLATSNP
jgi:hypothetical protein